MTAETQLQSLGASPGEMSLRIRNLVIALGVAYIDTAVDHIEILMQERKPDADSLIALLHEILENDSEQNRRFLERFGSALSTELQTLFGSPVGMCIYRDVAVHAEKGDLRKVLAEVEVRTADWFPLARGFLEARAQYHKEQGRLIEAIATTGLEAIEHFGVLRRIREARIAMEEHIRRMEKGIKPPPASH